RCVETLTGFKYIGAKLSKYERALPKNVRGNFVDLGEEETRRLRLAYSSFYVFGGEESYGYSGADFVRDKDGNGAVIMFCEVAAYAKSRSQTVDQLLDEIFAIFGYFAEKNGSLVFEGAEGASKIKQLVESYARHPFSEVIGSNLSESRRKLEKDSTSSGTGCKRMLSRVWADRGGEHVTKIAAVLAMAGSDFMWGPLRRLLPAV